MAGNVERKTDKGTGGKDQHRVTQEELDEALDETFPASDPVSVGQETGDEKDGPRGRVDRKPPLIDADEVRRLARKRPKADS